MIFVPSPYTIESIEDYTKDVKLFKLKYDKEILPGQFLELSIPGIGECPLASCSYDPKYIELLTRKAGNVTTYLFQLKKGDTVYIRGPYGKGWPIHDLMDKNLVLIAGGTGLAPVTSLIDYIIKNRKKFKKISLYLGFRDIDNVLLKEKIIDWKKSFDVTVVLSSQKVPEGYKKGFIQDHLKKEKFDKDTLALICGPEQMMEAVSLELNKHGIDNDKIYWSLERRMECGIGSCARCLIQDVYVCKDGPVFRYDKIKPKLDNEKSSNLKK